MTVPAAEPACVEWRWRRFDALDAREVHDLLRLRAAVFVVEQRCLFHDIDGRDPEAWHLLALGERGLAGCLRVFEPGGGAGARIGRVATGENARGTGLGHALMGEALRFCAGRFPAAAIELCAQSHLQGFYRRHGFRAVSEPYLEDGISHVDMRRGAAPS